MSEFADLLEVSNFKIRRWISDKNMPSKEVVTALKKKYTLIEVNEFWKWAEVNKEEVNFYKIKPFTLLPEPPWVSSEREKDRKEIPLRRNKLFTQEEDQQLLYLYFKENLTQKAIATIMNRSRDSIRNRLARLRNK
ncbi:sigma-70 family RNA polymerase sigma factor [Bacillus megaterium]|nr:sigma-70 family RNA polymerase sigma factor [Priestia megaterium]